MPKWLENLSGKKKDSILILLLLGILLLVITVPSGESGMTEEREESQQILPLDEAQILEQRLQNILSQVSGAGKTKVMITLKSGGKKIVEKDIERAEEHENADQEGVTGGSETISQKESTVLEKNGQGNETPYVTEELAPEIEGVLVISQGAGSTFVISEITEAVMALFGVEAHKIKVMKME